MFTCLVKKERTKKRVLRGQFLCCKKSERSGKTKTREEEISEWNWLALHMYLSCCEKRAKAWGKETRGRMNVVTEICGESQRTGIRGEREFLPPVVYPIFTKREPGSTLVISLLCRSLILQRTKDCLLPFLLVNSSSCIFNVRWRKKRRKTTRDEGNEIDSSSCILPFLVCKNTAKEEVEEERGRAKAF